MRYYLRDANIKIIKHKLIPYRKEIKKEKWILSNEGFYKYFKGDLWKFKIKFNDNPIIKNDILISSNFHWNKNNKSYNIPILHEIVDVEIIKYKLHPKSSTVFIIEQLNDKINDYYFISNKNIDDYSLKEDINSFLLILK